MAQGRTIETGTEHLHARVEDGVAVLTLNRPERRNALSDPMIQGLALALRDAETATDVACVVLTGAGGAFCSGGDVKGMAAASAGRSFSHSWSVPRKRASSTTCPIASMPKRPSVLDW